MTKPNLTASSRPRPRRLVDQGRLALHATWLEAVARRGPTVIVSAAFACELARALRHLLPDTRRAA